MFIGDTNLRHSLIRRKMRVLVGAINNQQASKGQTQEFKSSDVIYHPKFRLNGASEHKGYDIALIKLQKQFVVNNDTGLICLPKKLDNFLGLSVVAGWGRTETHDQGTAQLQYVEVEVFPHKECARYGNYQTPADGKAAIHLCAGHSNGGKDSCVVSLAVCASKSGLNLVLNRVIPVDRFSARKPINRCKLGLSAMVGVVRSRTILASIRKCLLLWIGFTR